MASITICDLLPADTDLFQDSESFLHELTEQEVGNVLGGVYESDGSGCIPIYREKRLFWGLWSSKELVLI
jgi:hypothetical protein